MGKKLCKNCSRYSPNNESPWRGSCPLMEDSNDLCIEIEKEPIDRCFSWDDERYHSGVFVGPNFGCIHWKKS